MDDHPEPRQPEPGRLHSREVELSEAGRKAAETVDLGNVAPRPNMALNPIQSPSTAEPTPAPAPPSATSASSATQAD